MEVIDKIAVILVSEYACNYDICYLDSGNVIYKDDLILDYFCNYKEAFNYKQEQEKIMWLY